MASLTLPDLPLDIILDVTDFLPPRSTASLALTCKKLYNSGKLKAIWIRGFDSRENLCGCMHETSESSSCPPIPLINHERYLFLQILSWDLPGKQLCDHCQCFHQQHGISVSRPWHKLSHLTRACGWTSVRGKPFSFFEMRYQLHFADAQQIMNLYRENEPSLPLLTRLSVDTDWSPQTLSYKKDKAEIFLRLMVEAKILSGGRLIIHSKQTMCISVWSAEMGWTCTGMSAGAVLKVCPHSESSDKISRDTDTGLRALSGHESVSGVRMYGLEGTNRCTSCLTEFSLSIDHKEEEGHQMTVESWTNLGTCEWSHQPAWQVATADTVLPDRFTLHQNKTETFETIRSLGYPSEHGFGLANKLNNRTVQTWPRISLMDRLNYSFDPPIRPPTPICVSWAPAPPDASLQRSPPNCPAPIPPTLPSSLLPPPALPSETSSSLASSSHTHISPATASSTSPASDSPKSALSALTTVPGSPVLSPRGNSSLELVDDQAIHSVGGLSPKPRLTETNEPLRVSRSQRWKGKWHRLWRKIKANVP